MRKITIAFIALLGIIVLAAGCGPGEKEKAEKLPSPETPSQVETPAPDRQVIVKIGTGSINGVYYNTAGVIARFVNQKSDVYNIRCRVETTDGPVFNVNAIMADDLQFGMVQSDRQYRAVNGLAEWEKQGPQKELRAVFSIHPESIILVAAVDSGIRGVADLKGKRVNIGDPGSGQRQYSIDVLEAVGINYRSDLIVENIAPADASGLLQKGRIDAFFYTEGHPSGAIKEATAGARKVRFASITGIETLLAKYPYYDSVKIPVKLYPAVANKSDVATVGVKATFVTSAKIPEEVVYAVTKEVFDNIEAFKKLHPALTSLTKQSMLEGLSAQIHPGAMRYYKESGLK